MDKTVEAKDIMIFIAPGWRSFVNCAFSNRHELQIRASTGADVTIGGQQYVTVGGYHSAPDIQNFPGFSVVVGRTSSTFYYQGAANYNFINPDPFVRFFLFPWLSW